MKKSTVKVIVVGAVALLGAVLTHEVEVFTTEKLGLDSPDKTKFKWPGKRTRKTRTRKTRVKKTETTEA